MFGRATRHCSFCGKGQGDVEVLIAGPDVFICDECVELCQMIVKEAATGKSKEAIKRAVRDVINA